MTGQFTVDNVQGSGKQSTHLSRVDDDAHPVALMMKRDRSVSCTVLEFLPSGRTDVRICLVSEPSRSQRWTARKGPMRHRSAATSGRVGLARKTCGIWRVSYRVLIASLLTI